MRKYYNYFVKDKLLYSSLIVLYSMIMVIVFNYFCYTVGLESLQLNVGNFKKIFILEMISYALYTYIGNVLTLWFMEKKENYKQIAMISIPLSIIVGIIHGCSNIVVGNVFIISFYFLYRYIKSNKLVSTFAYLTTISLIQCVFYYMKYQVLGLNYATIDNSFLTMILGLDYYLFLGTLIVVKNKIVRK